MTQEELQTLLKRLIFLRSEAFSNGVPNATKIQAINLQLKKLSGPDKHYFIEFVQELNNSLFDSGAKIPGLNLADFEKIEPEVINIAIEAISTPPPQKGYLEAFAEILECAKEELATLKNYFFLKLQSTTYNFQPLIIYEDGCYYHPIRKRITDKYNNCTCLTIKEFKEGLEKHEFGENSFVAMLIVSTKINEPNKIREREEELKIIFKYFDEVFQLSPKKANATTANDILVNNDIDSLLEEIDYITSSFLANAELSNDEEKIIKKLFRDAKSPILEYKVLKGGKSGSKVIEIRPKKHYAPNLTKRFIVKFSQFDEKKKISTEAKRFGDHIEHFSGSSYSKTYEKNATTEALKYTYASGNNITNSYSFAELLSNDKNEFHSERKRIVEDIFSIYPFELWQQSKEQERSTVKDLYKDYLHLEKFFEYLKIIKGIDDLQLINEILFKALNKIWIFEIDTNVKVCHGDFHSENFFKDSNGIYLIDFGFTDKRHAITDHTSLECSIKFKHVPFYIEQEILQDIEQQLLSDDSFNATFDIKTRRKDIKDYFDLIKLIRNNSLSYLYNSNSKLEYLISLFVLTCRHAQYSDLNQLYALKSAEIIGERLIQLLP
jgi:hypothetical protein